MLVVAVMSRSRRVLRFNVDIYTYLVAWELGYIVYLAGWVRSLSMFSFRLYNLGQDLFRCMSLMLKMLSCPSLAF